LQSIAHLVRHPDPHGPILFNVQFSELCGQLAFEGLGRPGSFLRERGAGLQPRRAFSRYLYTVTKATLSHALFRASVEHRRLFARSLFSSSFICWATAGLKVLSMPRRAPCAAIPPNPVPGMCQTTVGCRASPATAARSPPTHFSFQSVLESQKSLPPPSRWFFLQHLQRTLSLIGSIDFISWASHSPCNQNHLHLSHLIPLPSYIWYKSGVLDKVAWYSGKEISVILLGSWPDDKVMQIARTNTLYRFYAKTIIRQALYNERKDEQTEKRLIKSINGGFNDLITRLQQIKVGQ